MAVQKDEVITLDASRRTETGKGYARKLRKNGKIPAVLLGKNASTPLEVDPKWLSRVWQTGKRCNLRLDSSVKSVVIQELQIDAVHRLAIHVDFREVD